MAEAVGGTRDEIHILKPVANEQGQSHDSFEIGNRVNQLDLASQYRGHHPRQPQATGSWRSKGP